MYKVSIYNLTEGNMCYIKSPKFSTSKGFSFSSGGKFFALIEKHECKDYLSIYYTNDGKIVNTFALDLFDAVEVKWSPNNAYLVVWDNCINYRLIVFSHMRGQVLKYEPYNFALGIKTVKFSNNSLFLAVGSFDEKIRLLNGLTWQEIA
jgi:WD40 repeat protein